MISITRLHRWSSNPMVRAALLAALGMLLLLVLAHLYQSQRLLAAPDPLAVKVQGPDTVGSAIPVVNVGVASLGSGITQLNNSTANAAATNNQTETAVTALTNYVTGFEVTGAGATAGSNITVTLTGVQGGTQSWIVVIPAGAGVSITPLIVTFPQPLAASGTNTAITLFVPSFGAGNTAAAAALHGFRQ